MNVRPTGKSRILVFNAERAAADKKTTPMENALGLPDIEEMN